MEIITKVSIVYLSGYNEKPTTATELYLCQLKVMLLTALNIIFNPTEKGRMYTHVSVSQLSLRDSFISGQTYSRLDKITSSLCSH